jgi:cytochrome c-type biogenesis protein CcmH/NrfG
VQLLWEKNQHKRCHTELDEILKKNPDSIEALVWKGFVFFAQKELAQARMIWEKAEFLSHNPLYGVFAKKAHRL